MKIILVNKFWYRKGGAETVLFATKKILEDNGHTVEIFGMQDPKNEFQNKYFCKSVDFKSGDFLTQIKNSLKVIYNFEAKEKFIELIKDFQPDLIHFHNIYHQLSFSLVDAAREYKIPMVMTLHDYKMISPNYTLFDNGKIDESSAGGNYYRCFTNNSFHNPVFSFLATLEVYFRKWKNYQNKISLYISPSLFLKDKFLQFGFKENQITVLPNPILETLGLTETKGDCVAYVGRLSVEKGLEYLLASAKQLPQIKFKIIGTGPSEDNLKDIAKNLSNVEFSGYQSGETLQNLLQGAKLLVLPSVWYENYPLGVLEAKAKGKIILASKIGGLVEMLPEELLFTAADSQSLTEKIQEWYGAPEEKIQIISQKLVADVAEKNDPKKYYQGLLAIYEKVVNHN